MVETPGKDTVEQANQWIEHMDNSIQVHQLRQFLQTSSLVSQEGLVTLLQHFLAKPTKTDTIRDKIDFLLVQYFSQIAPAGLNDNDVDLAFVGQAMETVLGEVELKAPVWLNALDRVLESAKKCKSLDELLHGGVLEQGRKAKGLAGELFYLPVALVAFTRFGYLMRRSFFRLMLGDLNLILDGLTELEDKGIETIDCRRAQFSAQEPIIRLRMICQSWKVMFQAEYSSGSPLRMLVDLRASVEHSLGRGKAPDETKGKAGATAKAAAATAKPAVAAKPVAQGSVAATTTPAAAVKPAVPTKAAPAATPAAKTVAAANPAAAAKAAAATTTAKPVAAKSTAAKAAAGQGSLAKPTAKAPVPASDAPEFEVSSAPGWDPDAAPQPQKK
jgi:hypothetical protein